MLRVAFLPSDFNPMVLMLGEAEDLRALSFALRRFAREGGELLLDAQTFCAAPRLAHASRSGRSLACWGCMRCVANSMPSFGG